MQNSIQIKLSQDILSLEQCREFVEDDHCGGLAFFVGTVRDHTKGKSVVKLEFSAYEPMAVKEMHKIGVKAMQLFDIHKIAIHHTVGSLEIGDVPVIIAVSSVHRKAAFDACQFAIDTLKETVPIWKKEFFVDGEIWVNAHP